MVPLVFAQVLVDDALSAGKVLQILTCDMNGLIDGLAYFVLVGEYPVDASGCFLESNFAGASNALQAVALDVAFRMDAGSKPCLHICSGPWHSCIAHAGHRWVIHVNNFRSRPVESVTDP